MRKLLFLQVIGVLFCTGCNPRTIHVLPAPAVCASAFVSGFCRVARVSEDDETVDPVFLEWEDGVYEKLKYGHSYELLVTPEFVFNLGNDGLGGYHYTVHDVRRQL